MSLAPPIKSPSSFATNALSTQNQLTDRKLVEAEHVVDSDLRQDDAKEVGPLIRAGGDQEPAVAPSLRDELARGGPLFVDKELGARLEVVKDVLLVADGAGVAPGGAVLAAAAQVGDGDDAAGDDEQRRD